MADPLMTAWRIPSYKSYSYNLQPVQEVRIDLPDITQELAREIVGWCKENRDYVSLAAISPVVNVLEEVAYTITFYTKGAYEEFCKWWRERAI